MKLFAVIVNEKRKSRSIGGNEYLDIDLFVGNTSMAGFTLRRSDDLEGEGSGWGLYDHNEALLFWILDEQKKKGKTQTSKCPTCGEIGGRHSDDACEPQKG